MHVTSLALMYDDCRVWDSCGSQAPRWVLALVLALVLAGGLYATWRSEKRSGRTDTQRSNSKRDRPVEGASDAERDGDD